MTLKKSVGPTSTPTATHLFKNSAVLCLPVCLDLLSLLTFQLTIYKTRNTFLSFPKYFEICLKV